jgi:hypothetical protein
MIERDHKVTSTVMFGQLKPARHGSTSCVMWLRLIQNLPLHIEVLLSANLRVLIVNTVYDINPFNV